ncbi:MAG: hypothetical protein Q4G09_03210 [Clostridia bacterium]|nr:hypothetical protein [Clostridia bacterium]
MSLRKYGIWLKKYLQEVHPLKYSKMTIDCSLMEYLEKEEEYLYNYSEMVRLYVQTTHPQPKTHEFIVMAKYNQMIESIVDEYVRSEIRKIV